MKALDSRLSSACALPAQADEDSFARRLDPRVKLVVTLCFAAVVVSIRPLAVTELLPFFAYPLFLIAAGGVRVSRLGPRLLALSPFALAIGAFGPVFDHTIAFSVGPVEITNGWLSFASICLRFTLTVGAALVLVAVTGFDEICRSLRRLGAPQVFTTQLLLLHRYSFVLLDEARRMSRARELRQPRKRAVGLRVFGSLVGHLMLRSFDRAERIHLAMRLRGFDGELHLDGPRRLTARDAAFAACCIAAFAALRFTDAAGQLGLALLGGLS